MKNAINWFEIPTTQLDQAQAFYESVLDKPMHRENMGSWQLAIFPFEKDSHGVGGALVMGSKTPTPLANGVLIYLNANPSLDAALKRTVEAGGQIALERQALPEGLGFFACITDLDGNRVGLHALA